MNQNFGAWLNHAPKIHSKEKLQINPQITDGILINALVSH